MRLGLLADGVCRADLMEAVLRAAGHFVLKLVGAAAMRTGLRRESVDLPLLEVLNSSSGLEKLTWTQGHLDPCPPMIVVAGFTSIASVASVLNAGADDCLIEPFLDAMLVAKVAAVLRRTYLRRPWTVETYGPYIFDTATKSIARHDVAIAVTAKAFALTLMLFRNLGRCLSRGQLVEQVWGQGCSVNGRSLDAHVSVIRRRLRLTSACRLTAVYGFGYRLDDVGPTRCSP